MPFIAEKTLRIKWSKRENDWMIHYPTRPTGHLAYGFIGGRIDFPEFIKELKSRGYDLMTLKITCDRKPEVYKNAKN